MGKYLRAGFISFVIACLIVWATNAPAQGQIEIPVERVLETIDLNVSRQRTIRPIVFDGRPIFVISALAQSNQSESLSLSQRVEEIENRLHRVAQQITDPQKISLEVSLEPQSGQTVIYGNQEYLLTVTTLDAANQGLSVPEWAEQIRLILKDAFSDYYQERQLASRLGQGFWAGILLLGTIAVSSVIERYWHKWKMLKQALEQEITDLNRQEQEAETINLETQQHRANLLVRLRQWEDRHRLLRLGHIFLWISTIVVCLGIFPYTRGWQYLLLSYFGGTAFQLFLVVVVAVVTQRCSDYAIEHLFHSLQTGRWLHSPRLQKRIATFSGVTSGIANFLIVLVAILVGLTTVGVSIAPILASLGFIGLGLSLAAQDIIRDILNGMLILFEDQFAEGDMIRVSDSMGQVERMNLRITQLRNTEGALITIPNSHMRIVENLSNGWARVDLGIDVAYDTDLDRAIAVIEETALKMSRERGWRSLIIDQPQVLGVDHFGDNSITIRLWIKVQPLRQWDVAREYRLRLKRAFDRAGISMPFPQQELWFRNGLSLQNLPEPNAKRNKN